LEHGADLYPICMLDLIAVLIQSSHLYVFVFTLRNGRPDTLHVGEKKTVRSSRLILA